MTPVRISAEAEADLEAIWTHIAADSPDNADRFLDRLVSIIIQTLATAPLAGSPCDEFAEGLRNFPFESFVVFYRVTESAVEIVRIIHGARDHSAVFNI